MSSARLIPISLSLVVASLMLTACAGSVRKPVRAVVPAPSVQSEPEPSNERRGALRGAYQASRVTGDYAGYGSLTAFIQRMAAKHGFPVDYLNGLFSEARRKDWTLNYMAKQSGPSTAKPRPGAWSRYRAQFLSQTHIDSGAAFWHRHAQALKRASERYGVPPEYILGIMGVETIYGRNLGTHRVLDALTTLAFDYPRRADYFAEELENFLVMARNEGVDPTRPVGSFAGAMGLGQFMPGSFLRWAVDFDGDGRRDLWSPEDAIGSIANYFAQHGWRRGEPVVSPAAGDPASVGDLETGYDTHYSPSQLAALGIRPLGGAPADADQYRLLLLRGNDGDEFRLGHENFYVITRYNHSTHYAMAVHELAQAVKRRYLSAYAAER